MKTSVTIETTADQELVIGLTQTGRLVKASQSEVRDYFETTLDAEVANLNYQVKALMQATKAAESDVKGV